MKRILPFLLLSSCVWGQSVEHWTQSGGPLSLGYPVPVPVDTTVAFDGFRTYAGLHARHQELMDSNAYIQGHIVGQTVYDRDEWAYVLSDADSVTAEGVAEPAFMLNANIHAREWQTPEVSTGVMERFAEMSGDHHVYQYLLENSQIVIVPVNNIDGLLQTQRYPDLSYLGTDGADTPRDGRMRRKNMQSVDEDMFTSTDHLLGVDLNRNNAPYFGINDASSNDPASIVYRGLSADSEPETLARRAALALIPEGRVRMYADIHSFGQLFFSNLNSNLARNGQQDILLRKLRTVQQSLPANAGLNKVYTTQPGGNIGATDEYFVDNLQAMGFTLELEPTSVGGAMYGGTGTNGHDGFILPDSEIRRVRETWAETFMTGFYWSMGAPSVRELNVVEQSTGSVVYRGYWKTENQQRSWVETSIQSLSSQQNYVLQFTFNQPMRWLENGVVTQAPGQTTAQSVFVDLAEDVFTLGNDLWLTDKDPTQPYYRYKTDRWVVDLSPSTSASSTSVPISMTARNFMGVLLDSDPSTIVDWQGGWQQLETGLDNHYSLQVTNEAFSPPTPFQAGMTASWADPTHSGEGLVVEVLEDQQALVYWFTYDAEGQQRWFFGVGDYKGNRLYIPELQQVEGTQFGPGFRSEDINAHAVGEMELVVTSCETALFSWQIDALDGYQHMQKITDSLGLGCDQTDQPDQLQSKAFITGSWYDPAHSGEGITVSMLNETQMLLYWFTFSTDGKPLWLFGIGTMQDEVVQFDDILTTQGGVFGNTFNPDTVQSSSWGSITLNLNCAAVQLSYSSVVEGYGEGQLNMEQFTNPAGSFYCSDQE
ncbi:MAG: M14 family metallopeptidase [bacterium]